LPTVVHVDPADLGRTSSTIGANRGARILTNVGQCYRETQVSQDDVLPRCGPGRPRPGLMSRELSPASCEADLRWVSRENSPARKCGVNPNFLISRVAHPRATADRCKRLLSTPHHFPYRCKL